MKGTSIRRWFSPHTPLPTAWKTWEGCVPCDCKIVLSYPLESPSGPGSFEIPPLAIQPPWGHADHCFKIHCPSWRLFSSWTSRGDCWLPDVNEVAICSKLEEDSHSGNLTVSSSSGENRSQAGGYTLDILLSLPGLEFFTGGHPVMAFCRSIELANTSSFSLSSSWQLRQVLEP